MQPKFKKLYINGKVKWIAILLRLNIWKSIRKELHKFSVGYLKNTGVYEI